MKTYFAVLVLLAPFTPLSSAQEDANPRAPAVLSLKAFEALFERDRASDRTNLSWPLPRVAHALLYRAFVAELPLARRFDLPAGHSIAAIARRPD